MGQANGILAHQGGWDEALLIATPIVVFGLLFRSALARSARDKDGPEDGSGPR